MVAPTTGPFNWVHEVTATPSGVSWTYVKRRRTRTWYRQRRPHNLPLAFNFEDRQTVKYVDYRGGIYYSAYTTAPSFQLGYKADAYNKAYGKFVEAVNEQSMWAVNLLERRKSLDMVTNRATQLWRFGTALARGRFDKAARILGLGRAPKGVSRKKKFADNWLEYHFGWVPAIKDIGAAMHTLTDPFAPKRVKGRGSHDVSGSFTSNRNSTSYYKQRTVTRTQVKLQADIQVSNPNAFLLSQMGFVNPLSVLWETVPFSFIADWVANIGQILGSMTDFVGLQLSNSFQSYLQTAIFTETWHYGTVSVPVGKKTDEMFTDGQWQSVFANRTLGISTPTLRLKPLTGLSVTRGATAIALLLQVLKH